MHNIQNFMFHTLSIILFIEFVSAIGLNIDITCLSPALYIDIAVEEFNYL